MIVRGGLLFMYFVMYNYNVVFIMCPFGFLSPITFCVRNK